MFALFLVLCYFILIFNMIVPRISEKMRRERDAYVEFTRRSRDGFDCVNDALVAMEFTTSGVTALVAADRDGRTPLKCADRARATREALLSCDDPPNATVAGICDRAYTRLFFRT
ncbi:subunit of the poxvirus multiprotein entry-fusion complex [Squirrelpox virus]|uniref:Subunit of the poxvirus multiprotein entry-fusion complex n=1 Tax=Squirrelpox virus TaxID=240426 RepID=U3UBA9_9POXV|nr:subunit of the poxvirus multiprotein entry-fusion complex [Squirrelpox virus]CCD83292.1 subunit of the poxvirus multiprotein entry-fusion complex [Squirrelpox virus]